MTDPWNLADRTNLSIFLDSPTGRKVVAMAPEAKKPRPSKTFEETALKSERYFGFMDFPDWLFSLIATNPDNVGKMEMYRPPLDPDSNPL
jgi:hypothetical protein